MPESQEICKNLHKNVESQGGGQGLSVAARRVILSAAKNLVRWTWDSSLRSE